jgi:hypothetical protein
VRCPSNVSQTEVAGAVGLREAVGDE